MQYIHQLGLLVDLRHTFVHELQVELNVGVQSPSAQYARVGLTRNKTPFRSDDSSQELTLDIGTSSRPEGEDACVVLLVR